METRQFKRDHWFRVSLLPILSAVSFVLCLSAWSFGSANAASGFAVVTPNTVNTGSTSDFEFVYTASEEMGNGAVRMTTPNGFPDPTVDNTDVTVVDGMMADIIDDLEANPLPEGAVGWNVDDGIPLLNLANIGADTQNVFAGNQSVRANFLLNLGLPVLLHPSIYYNYAANDARDWSQYTTFSFVVRTQDLLAANVDLGQGELVIAEGANLSSAVSYNLASALLKVKLLDNEEWTQVIVDLSSHNASSRDAVMSYGLRFPSINLAVASGLEIDQVMAGPGSPVYDGNTVTANLIFLHDNGEVIFDYHDITSPGAGTYTFPIDTALDSSEPLSPIADQPEITVVDTASQCTKTDDPDNDGNGEIAVDTDCNGCFGDAYLDPDQSSVACIRIDGNQDACEDFFIDTNDDGCQVCPDVYWDPTSGVISAVTERTLDVNGDGTPEQVCAYDSDGDGEDDSFIDPNSENPNSGQVGGQGVGQTNPFAISGQGCSLQASADRVSPTQSLAGLCLLGVALLAAGSTRLRLTMRRGQ